MITPPSLPDGLLTFRHRCYLLTSGNDIESATAFVMLSILTTPSAMIRRPRVKTIPKAMLSILSPCWRLYTPRITGSIQGSARSFLAPSSCFLIVTAWPNFDPWPLYPTWPPAPMLCSSTPATPFHARITHHFYKRCILHLSFHHFRYDPQLPILRIDRTQSRTISVWCQLINLSSPHFPFGCNFHVIAQRLSVHPIWSSFVEAVHHQR